MEILIFASIVTFVSLVDCLAAIVCGMTNRLFMAGLLTVNFLVLGIVVVGGFFG